MPKLSDTRRLELIHKQRAELDRETARIEEQLAAKRQADDQRRNALLGAAIMAHFKGDELSRLISAAVPGKVKGKANLALFDQWLKPGATEPG